VSKVVLIRTMNVSLFAKTQGLDADVPTLTAYFRQLNVKDHAQTACVNARVDIQGLIVKESTPPATVCAV